MSKKIELNKVSAIYDEKTDKVMLISKDERFKTTGFITALDDSMEATALLRNELVEEPVTSGRMFETRTIPERQRNIQLIPLGFTETNQEVLWNVREQNDLLVTGKTASGKTTIVNSIVQYLQDETPYKVKHFSSDMGMGEKSGKNGLSLLEEANQIVLERLKESKETKNLRGSDHLFYVIDELEFINLPVDYRLHLLESVLRSGKYVGVHLIVASHSSNKIKDLGFDFQIFSNNVTMSAPAPLDATEVKTIRLSEFLVDGNSAIFKPYVSA